MAVKRELVGRIQAEERQLLEQGFRESMRAEAGECIQFLQPAFEKAIGLLRHWLTFGITPDTTTEQAIWMGQDAIAVFRAASTGFVASQLDSIVGIRVFISSALGVAPSFWTSDGDPASYGVTIGAPAQYRPSRTW